MKTKLLQIYYDMRHQPVIAWVSFIATALSVFLIMVVVMMQQVKVIPFAPESCRAHLLLGAFLHTESTDNSNKNSSSGMSYYVAEKLYSGLDGVEHTSYFSLSAEPSDVKSGQNEAFSAKSRKADAEFFRIFDHTLVEGRYYTKEEADAMMPVAVVSESTAGKAFGGRPWTGRQILVDQKPYTVIGVVRDNSSLATTACGDVFLPTGPDDKSGQWNDYLGNIAVALLVSDGVDFGSVREQVKGRYAMFDTELAQHNLRTVYHESPFDRETVAGGLIGSNVTPDPSAERRMRLAVYAILLIVPAINLSSMLHSRMRRRISEIGVRRAFGCTRRRIIVDIVAENFIVTLAGGLVGVIAGVIFAATYSGLYENMENFGSGDTPAVSALLSWTTVLIALGVCFVLNIFSASVPAWQASRLNPVNAINCK